MKDSVPQMCSPGLSSETVEAGRSSEMCNYGKSGCIP
jgi:hypothetical protein